MLKARPHFGLPAPVEAFDRGLEAGLPGRREDGRDAEDVLLGRDEHCRLYLRAWRKGELVSRTLLDQLVKLLTDENAELRETNVVLRREYLAAGEEIKRLNAILIDRAK
jgi:hypothetical protein